MELYRQPTEKRRNYPDPRRNLAEGYVEDGRVTPPIETRFFRFHQGEQALYGSQVTDAFL